MPEFGESRGKLFSCLSAHENIYIYLKIFQCGPFLKSLLNVLQYCFYCFYSVIFWLWGMCGGFLAPHLGIEPVSSVLEDKVLTTEPVGKSIKLCILYGYKLPLCLHLLFILPWTICSDSSSSYQVCIFWIPAQGTCLMTLYIIEPSSYTFPLTCYILYNINMCIYCWFIYF